MFTSKIWVTSFVKSITLENHVWVIYFVAFPLNLKKKLSFSRFVAWFYVYYPFNLSCFQKLTIDESSLEQNNAVLETVSKLWWNLPGFQRKRLNTGRKLTCSIKFRANYRYLKKDELYSSTVFDFKVSIIMFFNRSGSPWSLLDSLSH